MEPLEEKLRRTHPWWFEGSSGIDNDPHLRRLAKSPVQWNPPILDEIPLNFGDTHTLRGPRQAGKTTSIKRLMQRLIKGGETRVLYMAFDVALERAVIEEIVQVAKQIHPGPPGPWYIFFDEVTAIPDWQTGMKVAWDNGVTSDDAVLLTASSAHDLKRGAERLPGRRGKGKDYLHLPMSFRDYCTVVYNVKFDDEPVAAEEFLAPHGQKVISRLVSQGGTLRRAFSTYMRVGGFPAAVVDSVTQQDHSVSGETLQTLWDIIAGDITRSQRDQTAAIKLVQAVCASLGSPLSWPRAARAMGVESPHTAKQYAEFLAEIFTVLAVFYWDFNRNSLEPSKQRKLYFVDPIIGHMPRALIPGTPLPSEDGTVENIVASALFRSASQTLIQASAIPGAVGYWRSTNDREIDFMIPRVTDM